MTRRKTRVIYEPNGDPRAAELYDKLNLSGIAEYVQTSVFKDPKYRPPEFDSIDTEQKGRMTANGERLLFERFNFDRMKVVDYLTRKRKQVKRIEDHALKARIAEESIVARNRGLIYDMIGKMSSKVPRVVTMDDMDSECELTLMRAARSFNWERGFRFSTYACRSIFSSLKRLFENETRHGKRYKTTGQRELKAINRYFDYLQDTETGKDADLVYLGQHIGEIMDNTELNSNERFVIRKRFPLDGSDKFTLETIGKSLKVSKERVRQIQREALRKIRESDALKRHL